MGNALPSLSGLALIDVLVADGWQVTGRSNHGAKLVKHVDGRTRITIVPTKHKRMPTGTLMAILGPKQTGLGRQGLLRIIAEHT